MDCAGCGDCCDPVWLPHTRLEVEIALVMVDTGHLDIARENPAWVLAHFTAGPGHPEGIVPEEDRGTLYPWKCDAFDPETRWCTAHDERPEMCRDYPWYGTTGDDRTKALDKRCSHHWDVPVERRLALQGRLLPLWPVESTSQT